MKGLDITTDVVDPEGRPSHVNGVMTYPDGIETATYRCKKCGGRLNAIVGLLDGEICRNCAILYATKPTALGFIFHCYNIIWRTDSTWYSICPLKIHKPDKKCERCL